MTPAAKLEAYLHRKAVALGGTTRKYASLGRKGVCDRLVFLPGGQIILVEVKAPGDRISPLQRHEAEVMGKLGFITRFVRSKQDIDEVLG